MSGCRNRNTSNVSKNDIPLSNETDTEEIEEDDSDKFYYINLEQHVINRFADKFTINSIAKDITFIPLETTDDALLQVQSFRIAKINERYYISAGDVRSSNFSGILEFDTTGHFVKNLMLKNFGNGPNEIPRIIDWTFNHNTQLLVASSAYQILSHSFENNTTNKYTLSTGSWNECLLNDGTMVSLPSWDSKGNPDIPYLHFRNQESEIVKSIYYPEKRDFEYSGDEGLGLLSSYKLFPHYSGDALFIDMFSDTIQRIRSMNDIKPFAVLYRGSLAATPKDGPNPARRNQLIYFIKILETKKFFFIRYRYRNDWYNAIWDKKTQSFIANTKAEISEAQKRIRGNFADGNFTKYISPSGREMFIPISCYMDGKLYCVIDAEQAMEFIPDIVDDDNPVLMIIDID